MLLHYAFIREQVVLVTHKMGEHTWQSAEGMTKARMREGRWIAVVVCVRKGGNTKKANGRWARRDGTRLQYIQRPLGLSASKGTKHIQRKRHARTHCQHASSVEANSQNRVVQPRHCTQASYSSTLSLQPHSRPAFHRFTSSATHRDKDSGLWRTVTVQTPMRTDENKANSTHSR